MNNSARRGELKALCLRGMGALKESLEAEEQDFSAHYRGNVASSLYAAWLSLVGPLPDEVSFQDSLTILEESIQLGPPEHRDDFVQSAQDFIDKWEGWAEA